MSRLRVREGGPGDVDAVVGLETECLGVDAWSRGLVEQGLSGALPTVHYLVAELDAAVVGYAAISAVAEIAELQRIAVTPGARRTGVAGALLHEVTRRARESGADRVLLEVREANTGALRFYAATGFVEIDRRPRYYVDGSTAVVMRLPLRSGCGGS